MPASQTGTVIRVGQSAGRTKTLTGLSGEPWYREGFGRYTPAFRATVRGTPPIAYRWEFGDGLTSTEEMSVHLYPGTGVYSGVLYLRNCGGERPYVVEVACPVEWRIYLPLVMRG